MLTTIISLSVLIWSYGLIVGLTKTFREYLNKARRQNYRANFGSDGS